MNKLQNFIESAWASVMEINWELVGSKMLSVNPIVMLWISVGLVCLLLILLILRGKTEERVAFGDARRTLIKRIDRIEVLLNDLSAKLPQELTKMESRLKFLEEEMRASDK